LNEYLAGIVAGVCESEGQILVDPELLKVQVAGTCSTLTNLTGSQKLIAITEGICESEGNLVGSQKLIAIVGGICGSEGQILVDPELLKVQMAGICSTLAHLAVSKKLIGNCYPVYTNVFGDMKTVANLIGIAIANCSTISNLKILASLVSTVNGVASTIADLNVTQLLAGSVISSASIVANIIGIQKLQILIAGESGISASLIVPSVILAGSVSAEGSTLAKFSIHLFVFADDISAVSSTIGDFQVIQFLIGNSDSICGIIANLRGVQKLFGSVFGECDANLGIIIFPRYLLGQIMAQAIIQASIFEQMKRSAVFAYDYSECWAW